MIDRRRETQTQQFIKIYQGLKSQGPLDDDKIFETAMELLQQQRAQMKADYQEMANVDVDEPKLRMSEAFTKAKARHDRNSTDTITNSDSTKPGANESRKSIGGINIENLFKD